MKENFINQDETKEVSTYKYKSPYKTEKKSFVFWGETSGIGTVIEDVSILKPVRKIKYRNDLIVYALPGDLVRVGPDRLWLTKEVWKDVLGIDNVEELLRSD